MRSNMPGKNSPLTAASAILMLLASAHITQCAIVHGVLDSLALPRVAELTHTSATAAAAAASTAYSEVKNYFGDFHHGVKRTFHEHFHDASAESSITSFNERKSSSSKLLAKAKSASSVVEKFVGSTK